MVYLWRGEFTLGKNTSPMKFDFSFQVGGCTELMVYSKKRNDGKVLGAGYRLVSRSLATFCSHSAVWRGVPVLGFARQELEERVTFWLDWFGWLDWLIGYVWP